MVKKVQKILIAEDEKAVARVMEAKLRSVGFDVIICSNGEEALLTMDRIKVDLMILDLVMLKIDGFDVLKMLIHRKKHPPIIVFSNLGQDEDKQKVKELGVDKYFVKTQTTLTELVEQVKKLVDIKK